MPHKGKLPVTVSEPVSPLLQVKVSPRHTCSGPRPVLAVAPVSVVSSFILKNG